ncbi:hypothetical protein BU15DRAFT_73545 [Melanogaster broomeanus]|nr:hypothetical protein BU15DRAFT_73545 [Melanogaster broomeanus]
MEAHTASKSMIAEAHARIDNEIALLKLPICALLTQKNSLLPVSRLPCEILATIFLYQAHSFYQDPRYSGTWRAAPPWANVSYVCHHWRNVALSCQSLWSFLFVSPPRWTEELLSRSKTVPLRIRIDVGFTCQRAMIFKLFQKVTTDVTRIQDLSLKLPTLPYNLIEGVLSKLSTPAPLLHTLHLCIPDLGEDGEDGIYPDTLFNRETPALRSLEFCYSHMPWSSPIFTTLSTLRLRNIPSSSQPTITELLAMLRRIPDLTHLYLENAFRSAKDALTSQHTLLSESLDLPHLSRLALIAPFSAVVVFLSNVTVPLKTEIRLSCRRNIDTTESYTPLYPLLERRFNTTSDVGTVIRTLNIKTTSRDAGFVLSTSERDCDVSFYSDGRRLHEDWGCCIPLKLETDVSSSKDLEHLVGDICRIISMAHLHTLIHLASERSLLSLSFIRATFGNLQELQLIKLIELGVAEWISALSPGSCKRTHSIEKAPDIFAPALAELHVTAVFFADTCHPRSPECSGSVQCLRKALACRKAKGSALKKLVIAGSYYVSNAQVRDLRRVVDEVVWDGYTGSSDGEDKS